jgi:hypothetical protein
MWGSRLKGIRRRSVSRLHAFPHFLYSSGRGYGATLSHETSITTGDILPSACPGGGLFIGGGKPAGFLGQTVIGLGQFRKLYGGCQLLSAAELGSRAGGREYDFGDLSGGAVAVWAADAVRGFGRWTIRFLYVVQVPFYWRRHKKNSLYEYVYF